MINKGVGMSGMRVLTLLASVAIVFAAVPFVRPATVQAVDLGACTGNFIAYWQLGEPTGATTYNDCAGDHEATPAPNRAAPQQVVGKVGDAQRFRGGRVTNLPVSSWTGLQTPSAADFNFAATGSFSFEMWVKATPGVTCTTDNEVFIGRSNDTSTGDFVAWWVGCESGTGKARFSLRNSANQTVNIVSSQSITDGNWHHIVAVRDGAAGVSRLYVDGGAPVESSAQTLSAGFTAATPVTIGWYSFGSYHYNGTLDEVAVYGEALSAATIQDHYNGGAGKPYTVDTSALEPQMYLPIITK